MTRAQEKAKAAREGRFRRRKTDGCLGEGSGEGNSPLASLPSSGPDVPESLPHAYQTDTVIIPISQMNFGEVKDTSRFEPWLMSGLGPCSQRPPAGWGQARELLREAGSGSPQAGYN